MKRIRIMVVGSAAAMTIAGVGMAAASSTVQAPSVAKVDKVAQVVQQINAAEARARAAGSVEALAALQRAEAAVLAHQSSDRQQGRPSNPPPPCPSAAPNAGRPQACGKASPKPRPTATATGTTTASPTATATATGTAGPAACGVKSQGGTAAEGPVSSILYEVGVGVSEGGLAPVGDLAQQIACALEENLGL